MKTYLAGALGVLLLGSGAALAAAPSASADPYVPAVRTTTAVSGPQKVRQGQRAQLCVQVTVSGNLTPVGSVQLAVSGPKGRSSATTVPYSGGRVCSTTGKLTKRGGYRVVATYVPRTGSPFAGSQAGTGFKVVKKKRGR